MQDAKYIEQLERRIAALEALGTHCSSPDDRRLDNLLRKIARSVEMTAWLGTWCIRVAPVVAVIWFGGEQVVVWVKSFLPFTGPGR